MMSTKERQAQLLALGIHVDPFPAVLLAIDLAIQPSHQLMAAFSLALAFLLYLIVLTYCYLNLHLPCDAPPPTSRPPEPDLDPEKLASLQTQITIDPPRGASPAPSYSPLPPSPLPPSLRSTSTFDDVTLEPVAHDRERVLYDVV
jgi:hypothetical protein